MHPRIVSSINSIFYCYLYKLIQKLSEVNKQTTRQNFRIGNVTIKTGDR